MCGVKLSDIERISGFIQLVFHVIGLFEVVVDVVTKFARECIK